jgi:trimethylamine:corrinoid methyltransferase-like protein
MVKRVMEGIRVNKETIAADEIREIITTKKNYLGTKHSVKNTRKEIYIPELANRERRGSWIKDGAKDIIMKAKEKVDKILQSQKGPGLNSEIEAKLNEYFKIVSSRTMNDYRKLEGMEESEGVSEISGVKIE